MTETIVTQTPSDPPTSPAPDRVRRAVRGPRARIGASNSTSS